MGIIVQLWPFNLQLAINPCKAPSPKGLCCYYHVVTEAEAKEITFLCVSFIFKYILRCIFCLEWILPMTWCTSLGADRAVFEQIHYLVDCTICVAMWEPTTFPWAYPRAVHVPGSMNPVGMGLNSSWLGSPLPVQDSGLLVTPYPEQQEIQSLWVMYVLCICESSRVTSVWPRWLLKPQDYPCDTLAGTSQTSVLPSLHIES